MTPAEQLPEAFLDDLAAIVDGDPAALERWADLLADSEAARDLRHEAQQAREAAAQAGLDYVPPADLDARVLAAIDARDGGGPATGAQGGATATDAARDTVPESASPSAHAPTHVDTRIAELDDARPASSPETAASSAPASGDAGEPDPADGSAPKEGSGRKGLVLLLGGVGVALAAAAAFGLWWSYGRGEGELRPVDGVAVAAWSGELDVVAGPAPSEGGASGVTLGGQPASQGAAVGAGQPLVTDARTRARLALSDGTILVLDRDTELSLGADGRRVELKRGRLLAEVAHLDQGPNAQFQTPAGRVEVIGTKFVLTASEEEATVRVTRGAVRVHAQGQSVEVKTGEEGLMRAGAAPHSVPAVDLAASVGWSELDAPEDDLPVPGLGELRAHRPGEREEQERPLTLAHHQVTVRIVGSVARTEVEEVFRNDSDQELEGVYRFPLPPDARIASLGLVVEDEWEEGAFVSKERAARIWRGVIRNATPERQRQQEEFIWVPGPWRDPALLEWQQGGRFELRIFPIPANGERRVRIAYEQIIPPHGEGRRYVYPLAHANDDSTRVGHFEVDVRVAGEAEAKPRGYPLELAQEEGAQRLRYTRQSFRPSGDLIIDYRDPSPSMAGSELRYWSFRGQAVANPPERSREDEEVVEAQRALFDDDRGYALFALRPELPARGEARARDYLVVADASQSMVGERYARAARLVQGVVAEMDRRDRVTALACHSTCRAMEGPTQLPNAATAEAIREFLEKEEPAGASNLVAALGEALEHAEAIGAGGERELHVVYVGDGVATVGHRRAGSLAAEVEQLFERPGRSAMLTTVGLGQDADGVALGAMARAGGGHYVPYVPGQRTAAAALAVLETTYGASLEDAELVFPEGLVEVAPSALPTIRAGQELLVAARLERPDVSGEVVLRGKVGGQPFEQRYPVAITASTAAGNAFVPRLWAAKTIQDLELRGRSEDTDRIVALSKGYGVMSRHTSLLVLESEAMFRAFGVDRARPTLQWTGEEEMEYGEAAGQVAVTRGRSAGGTLDALAQAPRMRPSASSRSNAASGASLDDVMGGGVGLAEARDRAAEASVRRRRTARRRPMRRMRKVWFREGRVARADDVRDRDMAAVREAEEALRAEPDSRDRHKELVRALSRAGMLARAEEMAREWLRRDALDPEALTYLSDVIGRQGQRERSLRVLTGIVDLDADNVLLQKRLANAFERAGEARRACDHRVSLAEIEPDDEELVADAVRCERALGRPDAAERLLELVEADERDDVNRRAERAPTPERVRGDVLLEASWTGSADVDLTLVTPQGTRISWMGGRTTVVGDDATRLGRERLGLRRATPGTYYVEVTRADPNDTTPVRGEVRVRAFDERQTIPFELSGDRSTVGRVQVVRRWRLEPAPGGRPRGPLEGLQGL